MGLANKERIHSQFLFWFITLDSNIISDEIKSEFLSVFLSRENSSYDNFYAYTEKNNIDIIITTDTSALVIENKLKASQSAKQTLKYDAVFDDLCQKEPEKFKRKETTMVLLSLINEKPESSKWTSITYNKLLESFERIFPKLKSNYPEVIIIGEYIRSIETLLHSFEYFIEHYYEFPQFFSMYGREGSSEKSSKIEYIENLGLGVIFQKGFYTRIMENIENYYKKNIEWKIEETRRMALIQIIFKSYGIKGNKYFLGLQYQGDTLKINFQNVDYWKSEKKEEGFLLGVKAFNEYSKNDKPNGYTKINPPQKYAYISISKTHGLDKFRFGSLTAFCEQFKNEIELALPVINNIDKILNKLIK